MYNFLKRIFDVLISFMMLIMLLPIIIIVGVVLFAAQRDNPFFLQKRPGLNEKIFKIIKFKTMTSQRDEFGVLLPDEMRITRVGSFVRKSSLDEIPQLINVLKGDMSVIGPRPLLTEYLELYNENQKKRHNVRPGITGWAQVNGRNALSWEQKFKYDAWYVENLSFRLDIKIFFMTFVKVFKKEGINSSKDVTMEKFHGNKK